MSPWASAGLATALAAALGNIAYDNVPAGDAALPYGDVRYDDAWAIGLHGRWSKGSVRANDEQATVAHELDDAARGWDSIPGGTSNAGATNFRQAADGQPRDDDTARPPSPQGKSPPAPTGRRESREAGTPRRGRTQSRPPR